MKLDDQTRLRHMLEKEKKKKSTKNIQAISIKLEDLPRHKMGKELSKVDRTHIYTNER